MIFNFTVSGFQSIRKPVRVMVEGYCVVEGESNLGKTALVRAIHAALSNRAGSEFLPDDEALCGVSIQSNGHTMEWERNRKTTVYRVNGQEVGKVGRGAVPEEIKIIGISAIKTLDKVQHWPQIHLQWDQPFIIGSYTDTIAAELLGASAETSKISRAIKLVNSDVTKCKTKTELLEAQHKNLSVNVQIMEEIATRINGSQQIVDQREQTRNESLRKENTYKSFVHQYRLFWGRWKIVNPLSKMVLPKTPDCTQYEKLHELYQKYTRTRILIDLASKNRDAVPVIPEGRQRVIDLTRLYQESLRVSQQVALLRSVALAPAIQVPDWQAVRDRFQALGVLQDRYVRTQRELDSSSRLLTEISQSLGSIDKERKKFDYLVGTLERCPLCSSPMKNGKFCVDEACNA